MGFFDQGEMEHYFLEGDPTGSTRAIFGFPEATAKRQEQLLELQQGQEEILSRQQGISRARQTRAVMASATAHAAASGFSTASSSFQNVQRSSFDTFQKDNDMEKLNLSVSKAKFEAQKEAIKEKETGGVLGGIGGLMGTAASIIALA